MKPWRTQAEIYSGRRESYLNLQTPKFRERVKALDLDPKLR